MTINEKMTAIADEVRALSGATDTLNLDEMASHTKEANTEIEKQGELIAQIQEALQGKASGGGGGQGSGLPSVSPKDNDKVLTVVGGAWQPAMPAEGANGLMTKWDDKGNNVLYLTKDGVLLGTGVVLPKGGGGGGSTNDAVMTLTNTSGWLSKTIADGADCYFTFYWDSIDGNIPTGNGTLMISVGGAVKASYEIEQGDVEVNLSKYLTASTNRILLEVVDSYGNTKTLSLSISTVSISIASYFDGDIPYTGNISFAYTPVGAVNKKVHFILDGEEIGTQDVAVSGREVSYTIPAQPHGSHTFEVYFTADINGQYVDSNRLYYDLITYEEGNSTPIISVPLNIKSAKQYSSVAIPYIVYTPNILTSAVTLKDGDIVAANLTVDRTRQVWSYKALVDGEANLSIVSGDTVKPISFDVTINNIAVNAETENLELYLSSEGRSNNEENPLEWKSGTVAAELTGFNLTSDGWKLDDENNTVLRVSGDARVYIPFNIFGSDFRTTGKTIEIEFATRDVLNYDAIILSSWSGERGIKITAQKALLKSEQSEIFTQYKENETVRIAFTIEKRAENRLLAIYINGIMSGVVQYDVDDDFSQSSPVGISIGSNYCTTDIYCIRVYRNNLNRYQILDNWIADTQDIEKLIERYERNDIFDDYGNITASKIPSYLPYMVLNVGKYSDLPQKKEDKKTVSGSYIDPLHPERSFTFADAEIDVQGTSSQYYARKNYIINFKGGFIKDGVPQYTYQMRETSMPTDTFTFKADVASSEGANNVELARLYDDTCPVKTAPQKTDSRVRQGIEGYPMLMFYGEGNDLTFLGKYNFNNDKETPEIFGFKNGDESWEVLQNNTQMVIWKDDDFTGDAWEISFKGRYPVKNKNTTNLAAFSSWLKSTDTTAVSSESEKAARLAKFKSEFADWCNVDAMLFNYIFTEMFLMVDNRAKNAFPTRYAADGKWLILPYDYDTAIGINNEGELKFGYELEDTDLINGNNVYNGQDSVLYVNMRLAYAEEIMEMYKELRNGDVFSYEEIEKRFEEHQSVWGEAVFNEDARFKYIDPLVNEGNETYLPMLQGSKAEQRKWWLYNRFRYLDSKYNAGDTLEDYIMLRSYAVADIEVTPYADIYASAKFDSALVQKRALRGGTYTLENPLSGGRDAVIAIYSASQLSSVGDLSGLKPGMADFSKAVKLSSLKVGDNTAGYDNPNLTDLTIGNLTLLRTLDVRNCSALTQSVDVSGCTNIENVYLDGTATTGVTLPNGGILKVLHLPSTITNLTIRNQKNLTEFVLPSYANVSTLRVENTPVIDTKAALNSIQANSRVRLVGVDWTFDTSDDILAFMDKLDTFRGLDENGNNIDKAVVSGVIHVNSLTSDELAEMNARYPNIKIDYKSFTVFIRFYNGETLWSEQKLAVGDTITAPASPTKDSTVQYNYVFKGWSLDGDNVVDLGTAPAYSVNYYSVFDAEVRYYTVRFLNGSTVLQTTQVAYGDTPVYTGATPTPETEGFTFVGWTPKISAVTGDIDYVALFTVLVRFYDGNTLLSEQKLVPGSKVILPANPTKQSTAQYDYTFKGWSIDGENVVDVSIAPEYSVDYYPVFDAVLRYYTVRFITGTTVLQSTQVAYGQIPVYTGATPTPEPDCEFVGWTPSVTAVTGNIDYVALFTVIVRFYYGETLLSMQKLVTGDKVAVPANPTKESTAQYEYPFKGWSIDGTSVVSNVGIAPDHSVNYYALFYAMLRHYTVRFLNGTTVLQSSEIAYGQMPAYMGEEPTPETEEFVFVGWTPEITVVTGNIDYVALFRDNRAITRQLLAKTITEYSSEIVTVVGANAFYYCTALTSVNLPNATSLDSYAISNCTALTSVNLPNVTKIGQYGLNFCSALTSVDLPNVTEIGGYAFNQCKLLTTLILRSPVVCTLKTTSAFQSTPFNSTSTEATVYVPQALVETYQAATNWSKLYTGGKCNFVAIEGSEYE